MLDDIVKAFSDKAAKERWAALALNALTIFVSVIAPNVAFIMYIIMTTMFITRPFAGARRSH